jgi:hypothetical protein
MRCHSRDRAERGSRELSNHHHADYKRLWLLHFGMTSPFDHSLSTSGRDWSRNCAVPARACVKPTASGEGRKSYAESAPELALAAKRLHRRSPKGHRRSLHDIARELAQMGFTNRNGAPYSAACIKSMVEGPAPAAAT